MKDISTQLIDRAACEHAEAWEGYFGKKLAHRPSLVDQFLAYAWQLEVQWHPQLVEQLLVAELCMRRQHGEVPSLDEYEQAMAAPVLRDIADCRERFKERIEAPAGPIVQGAVDAMEHYGMAQMWPDLERWGERLRTLADQHPHQADMQEALAQGASFAMNAYGTAQMWPDLERWGERLRLVAEQHPHQADIRKALAVGASNAVTAYRSRQQEAASR